MPSGDRARTTTGEGAGALVLAAQRAAGDAGVLVCERVPSDLLAAMIHEFGPIEPSPKAVWNP